MLRLKMFLFSAALVCLFSCSGGGGGGSADLAGLSDFSYNADVTLNLNEGDSFPSAENITVEAGRILTINGPGTVTVPAGTSVTLKDGAKIQLENGASIDSESQHRITSEISSETGLSAFAGMMGDLPGINGSMQQDVDASGSDTAMPMCSGHPYTGTFNGNGHTLTQNSTEDREYGGVFEVIGMDGTVENLTAAGTVFNAVYAGGIAAYNYGVIKYCFNDCLMYSDFSGNSPNNKVNGGICVYNYGIIDSCALTSSDNNNEGLRAYYEEKSQSVPELADGNTLRFYMGGIAVFNSGEIRNCITSNDVLVGCKDSLESEVYLGGIAAVNIKTVLTSDEYPSCPGTYTGVIKNCAAGIGIHFSFPIVFVVGGKKQYGGGITAYNEEGCTVENCSFSSIMIQASTIVGGCIGLNEGTAGYLYSLNSENVVVGSGAAEHGYIRPMHISSPDSLVLSDTVFGQHVYNYKSYSTFKEFKSEDDPDSSVEGALNGWVGDTDKNPAQPEGFHLYKNWKIWYNGNYFPRIDLGVNVPGLDD